MEKFVQEFKRATRESGFERRLLIKEFKREMNGVTQKKLMKVKYLSRSIKQQYSRIINILQREQIRRGENKKQKIDRKLSLKNEHINKYQRNTKAIIGTASSLVKETEDSVGASKICSNG